MYYTYVHSKKIKTLSIVILIINIILSFVAGSMFQVANIRESYYYGGEYNYITEYSYNWKLAITLAILSVIAFIIFYVLAVNVVEAIEDVTAAINRIPDKISNVKSDAKEPKSNTHENPKSIFNSQENNLANWTCPSCGRLNKGDKLICDCGYRK